MQMVELLLYQGLVAGATLLQQLSFLQLSRRAPHSCVSHAAILSTLNARAVLSTYLLYTQDHATIRNSLDYEYCRCKDSDAVRFWIRRPGASTLLPLTWQDINDLAIQKHGSSNWDQRNICRGEFFNLNLPLHWLKKNWPKISSKSLLAKKSATSFKTS